MKSLMSIVGVAVSLVACGGDPKEPAEPGDGPMERAGEEVDEAGEAVSEEAGELADDAEEAVDGDDAEE